MSKINYHSHHGGPHSGPHGEPRGEPHATPHGQPGKGKPHHAATLSDAASGKLFSYPDESFQTLTTPAGYIVLDISDGLVIGGSIGISPDMSDHPSVRIYAEAITLAESLSAQDAFLMAQSLTAATGVEINANGAPGNPGGPNTDASGVKANDGTPGQNGYDVTLVMGFTSNELTAPVVTANGGNGGNGQNNVSDQPKSQGGDGKNGGNGGTVLVAGHHLYAEWISQLKAIIAATTAKSLNAAIVSLQSQVAAYQPAQSLTVVESTTNPPTTLTLSNAVAKLLTLTAGSQQLTALCQSIAWALEVPLLNWQSAVNATCEADPGAYGAYGTGVINGSSGQDGTPGTKSVTMFPDYATLIQNLAPTQANATLANLLYLHPEQCMLLLQKAEMLYFAGDPIANPGAIAATATYLDRLIERTAPFANIQTTDQLYLAYADSANEALLGSGDCIQTLKTVQATASILKQQLREGKDYFGHPYNYAPLASYEFYQAQFKEMLGLIGTLETAYTTYFTNLANTETAQANLSSALSSAQSVVANAQNDINTLYGQLASTLTVIESYAPQLQAQFTSLNSALDQLGKDIPSYFDFNVKTIMSALSTIAFDPGSAAMWAVQAGQTIYQFTTQVTEADGTPVDKQYLLQQVTTVQGDIDSLMEGYQAQSDGTFNLDDPSANMLLTDQSTLYQTLDKIYNVFPSDVTSIKQAYQTYVNLVLARNQQILTYNAMVLLIGKKQQQIADAKSKIKTISAQLNANYNPNLPVMTTFVSRIYHQARQQVLETLYRASRALRFWSLTDDNVIASLLADNSVATINTAILTTAEISLLDAYQGAVEDFGASTEQIPPSNSAGPGILVSLSDDQIATLQAGNAVSICLNAPYQDARVTDNPFAGMYNVRVREVRLWLEGASTSDNVFRIDLTHTGQETLINKDNDAYVFVHDPVIRRFTYTVNTDGSTLINSHADFNNALSDDDSQGSYALLGPFTWWYIQVSPNYNANLDLSGLTTAMLEFYINYYPF